MDTHPYLAFDGSAASEPIATGLERTSMLDFMKALLGFVNICLIDAGGMWPLLGCTAWNSGAQSVNNRLESLFLVDEAQLISA